MELLWIGIGVLVGMVIVGFLIVWLIKRFLQVGGQAYRDTIDKM